MISITPSTMRAPKLSGERRTARALTLSHGFALPSLGADVIGLGAIALLALCIFEAAAWLAAAPLTTLVYFVASAPALLFLVAVVSERKP